MLINPFSSVTESLLSTMTKLIDEKLKEESAAAVDDPPEKRKISVVDKENILEASDLYRNPILHKSQFDSSNSCKKEGKDSQEKEKEEDTMAGESIPDNDRHIPKPFNTNNNKINQSSTKLRRSESLNKPERTVSPMTKLKRSESLNKGDKLKRSDSLSKTEKTENNNKRREITLSNKRVKDSTKNKRKNGMPDRSIKRRHTVGGTKDPDKITWLRDSKYQEEVKPDSENIKEKNLRTSSPDLSSTRRERFLFEINLMNTENMVVALRQHLIGTNTRPQSFPESFKVPLESHVWKFTKCLRL